MDYEKKYKEALRQAEEIIKYYKERNRDEAAIEDLQEIFPELKESKDEKIRKTLIEYFNAYPKDYFGGLKKSYILAWLEKQGEKKSLTIDIKSMVDSYEQRLIKNGGVSNSPLVNMCVAAFRYGVENTLDELHLKQILANSCETCKDEPFDYENATIIQKDFAPNVEAKFKVGDFIVNDYCMGKIVEITNDAYLLDTEQGIPFSCHSTRLWDITKDAKDGDVLAAHECVVLFKEIDGLNIKCYCTYHYMGFNPSFYVDTLQNKTAFHPATKEQRDLLFQKMKESGYEWNAENKEVKKISQRIISAEAKEAMYDKLAWSEEDEEHYNACLNYFEEIKPDSVFYKDYLWLKSLKERIKVC